MASRYDPRQLEEDSACIAAIDLSGRIAWANRRWFAFGAENGARSDAIAVGVNYFGAAIPEIRAPLLGLLTASRGSGKPFDFDYECSSASQFRLFRLRGYPFADGALMVHSLRVVRAHDQVASEADLSRYETRDGLVVMCANCRRTRREDQSAWDWIPAWVTHPPRVVSHGICETCVGFHWGRPPP